MISVIMPSYLGDYPNAATNREEKLPRAIESFLAQEIGELIVVADGCEKTAEIARKYPVRLVNIQKQPPFSGTPRNIGILIAKYDYIAYLDNDDMFGANHLKLIAKNIDADWLYWDDYVNGKIRPVWLEFGRIGTSAIAHKKDLDCEWGDGYGHDWEFIKQLNKYPPKRIITNYQVMHIPGVIDQ
jgi:glycosyltransferase involved in cell wall biosynthesis